MMKTAIASAMLAVVILAGGCRQADPFAPVNVPDIYSIQPDAPIDEEDMTQMLNDLHKIDPEPYKISPGDQFNIMIYEHPELTAPQVLVTPDGYIGVPLVGPVKIGGLSLIEANDLLTEKLSRYIRTPVLSLIPVQVRGYSFTIVGRVNHAGCYPISIGKTRLVDAIAMAQGFSQGTFRGDSVELADLESSYISRNGAVLPVDFKKALLQGDPLHNIPLRNGDFIYIPSTMNSSIAILGEVGHATFVGFNEGMTLVQALTYGRGLLETHDPLIKIIRGGLNHPVVYTLDVDKILLGAARDFQLRPNDIIFVPRDGMSEWNVAVRKLLPMLQPLGTATGAVGIVGAAAW